MLIEFTFDLFVTSITLFFPDRQCTCIPYIYLTDSSDEFANGGAFGQKLGRSGQNGRLSAFIF